MDSSLPWFMFWMKKMMVAFIGNDYKRGLNLLKDYAEDGKIHSKLNWLGESQFPGCDYINGSVTFRSIKYYFNNKIDDFYFNPSFASPARLPSCKNNSLISRIADKF